MASSSVYWVEETLIPGTYLVGAPNLHHGVLTDENAAHPGQPVFVPADGGAVRTAAGLPGGTRLFVTGGPIPPALHATALANGFTFGGLLQPPVKYTVIRRGGNTTAQFNAYVAKLKELGVVEEAWTPTYVYHPILQSDGRYRLEARALYEWESYQGAAAFARTAAATRRRGLGRRSGLAVRCLGHPAELGKYRCPRGWVNEGQQMRCSPAVRDRHRTALGTSRP